MKRLTNCGIVLAAFVAGCSSGNGVQEVHGTLERDRLELVAESHERIIEIPVREGDRVAGDAVLVRQEAGTMQPRLDQARASLDEAERRLAELQSGPRQREIDEARAALSGAEHLSRRTLSRSCARQRRRIPLTSSIPIVSKPPWRPRSPQRRRGARSVYAGLWAPTGHLLVGMPS
jgi:multidrug efflux pump subunit AcrA (membrane-fusion protein)